MSHEALKNREQIVVGIQRFICLDGSIYVVMYLCSVMGLKTK
jgi:hypothetical protein